jgi:hypothetical protein
MVQTEIEGRVGRRLEVLFGKGIVFLFLFLVPQFAFGQGEQFQGTIVTEEGQTRVVKHFTNLKAEMHAEYRGSGTGIPITDIKSILRVEEREGGWDTLLIKSRDGREFKVEGVMESMVDDDPFKISTINPATGEYSEETLWSRKIKKIVFGENYGSLRRCPDGGKTFPPDYVYCPYHKTELQLIQVGE